MATAAETLQTIRVLFEAQVGTDRTLLESFDSLAATLKAQIAESSDPRRILELQSAAFEEGVEALEGELIAPDYHPQSTGVWNHYKHQLWLLDQPRD